MSYDDGKQLSNLQRIHELEEMVSELEEKNTKLRQNIEGDADRIQFQLSNNDLKDEFGVYGCDIVERMAEAIVTLRVVNAELRELLRWRDVDVELPKPGTGCIAILGESQYAVATRYTGDLEWKKETVSFWRPIGPLPGGD
jgi:hypothetical protein